MPSASDLRGIIFDWSGVFCSPGEPFSHPELARQTGLSIEQMEDGARDLHEKYYRGAISGEEFWLKIIERFGLHDLSPQDLTRAYLSSYKIYPGTLEFAASFRPRYKTAILSNLTTEMMANVMRNQDIVGSFDVVLFSNITGKNKPEPESFAEALAQLGTTPQETLFIDDSQRNIAAAEKLGMQTLKVESPEQWTGELCARTSTGADRGTFKQV